MSNFIFLSSEPKLTVENLKLTVRFKRDDITRSEWVLRIIVRAPKQEVTDRKLVFYLLIKQAKEEEIRIEDIVSSESHNLLKDSEYLEYMGRSFKVIDEPPHKLETHENYEFEYLRQEKLIFPGEIEIKEENPLDFEIDGKSLRKIGSINNKDIGLRIYCPKTELIKGELYILQFRLVLKDFIPPEVFRSMEDPGSAWALGINLHNRAENEEIFSKMPNQIPEIRSLELWVSMPHRHLILDSSPRYKALYWFSPWDKEKMEELQNRYESLKKSKEFMNVVGDVWVKIVQDNHNEPEGIENEFTIIGFSPWIGSKLQKVAVDLDKLAKDLVKKDEMMEMEKKLQKQEEHIEKTYISYRDTVFVWGFLASMLTVTLTFIVLAVRELAGVSVPIKSADIPGVGIETPPVDLTLGVMIGFAVLCSMTIIAFVYGGRFILKRLGVIK